MGEAVGPVTIDVQPLHALRRWIGITGFSATTGWPKNDG